MAGDVAEFKVDRCDHRLFPRVYKSMKPAHSAKYLVQSLRRLPAAEPPPGLNHRIMAALPRRRGLAGRLEYGVRTALHGQAGGYLLPSGPAEMGLLVLSTGLFFCCLTAVISLRLRLPDHLYAFLPAFAAGLLLMHHGWRQLQTPDKMIVLRSGLAVVCGIFAVNAILGLFYGVHSGPGLIATWLGLSGIMVAGAITLVLAAVPRARRRYSATVGAVFNRDH